MKNKINFKKIFDNVILICFLLFPFAQLSGPFFTDFFLSLIGFLFIIIVLAYKKFHYLNNFLFKILILWWIYLVINSTLSENPLLSLESSLFYFRFVFFAFAIWYILENIELSIKYITICYIIVFLFLIIDSLFQYFYGYNFFGFKSSGNRISGIFNEEQILGSYISRLLPFIIGLIIFNFNKNKYILYLIIFIFIFSDLIIYLSGERSAFFNLILGTFLMMLLIERYKLIRICAFTISIILIILISITNNSVKYRMIDHTFNQMNLNKYFTSNLSKNNINDKDISREENIICSRGVCNYDDNRILFFSIQHQVLYDAAFKMFKDNIFFGIGPKMYREYCKKNIYYIVPKQDVSSSSCSTHPHSTYIQLLAETGIFGFISVFSIFLFVTIVFLRRIISLYFVKNKYYLNDQIIFMYIAIFITLWPIIPTGNFFNNYLNAIYFLPLGFLLYFYNIYLNKKDND